MKGLLVTSCAVLLALAAFGTAQANDFSGFYVGGHIGGSFGRSDATTTTVFSPTGYFATTSPPAIAIAGVQHITPKTFAVGGGGGYNFQRGNLIIGGEVDYDAMRLSDAVTRGGTYPCCAPTAFTVKQSINTTWLFTARPRVGFVMGRLLVYGTGGLALTNLNYQSVFNDTFATATENGGVKGNKTGWTVGGGAEWQVAPHISLKGEYLYASFGSVTTTSTNLKAFTPPIAFPANVFTHTADFKTHIGRAGINIRF